MIKTNRIVKYIFETNRSIDLNELWIMCEKGFFTKKEMKEFYYLIGSSENFIAETFDN